MVANEIPWAEFRAAEALQKAVWGEDEIVDPAELTPAPYFL